MMSSAPGCNISVADNPPCPGVKPMSSAPTRLAAVCSTPKPLQPSRTAPICVANCAASDSTAAPSGRARAPCPRITSGFCALTDW